MSAILEFDFTIDLINYAFEKDLENTAWELWISKFPLMDKENFISFEDFKNTLFKKKYTNKSYDDIEKEMENVIKAYERQVK